MNIQKLKETESYYDDRINIKYIKLKNLEELEKTGFSIQDLKKIKRIFIEIASEYKITNIEEIKAKFFELFEKFEDRISLDSENNSLLKTSLILENQIRINRQTLHCQEVVGPILKNLFERGITEIEIIAMKVLIDILLYNSSIGGNDIIETNIKYENLMNLFNNNCNNSNSNWRREYEKIKSASVLNLILVLNAVFEKIQYEKDKLRSSYSASCSFPSISSYENSDSDDRKQEEGIDSII